MAARTHPLGDHLVGVGVEDVVVALLRRRHPDVRVRVPGVLRVLQVRDQHGVVDGGAVALGRRLEVADRVEVRDVHAVGVRLGAVGAVLLHVHREEADLGAVHLERKGWG